MMIKRTMTIWIAAALALTGGGLAGCDASPTPTDGGGTGTDARVTLMDGGGTGTDGGGTGTDAGPGTGTDGGTGTCGPMFTGDCNVLVDIQIAGGASGLEPACGAGMACLPGGEEMGGQLQLVCVGAGVGTDGTECTAGMAGVCAEGFSCSQFDDRCRRLCCGNTDCAAGTQYCEFFGNTSVGVCRVRGECSILDQTGCDTGEACYHATMGEGSCGAEGSVAVGAECGGTLGQCVGGAGCFGNESDGYFCRTWCNPTADPDTCAEGFSCAMFNEGDPPSPVPGIGFCAPDPG
jgi:hypothetical protein